MSSAQKRAADNERIYVMDIKISKKAETEVMKLARQAAKADRWMEPVFDSMDSDWDRFQERHRRNWEETEHFRHYYDRPIDDIVAEEEKRVTHGKDKLSWEDRFYGIYDPLKELFWDTWEQKVKLYEKWEKEST